MAELDSAATVALIDTILCDPAAAAQAEKRLIAVAELARAAGGEA